MKRVLWIWHANYIRISFRSNSERLNLHRLMFYSGVGILSLTHTHSHSHFTVSISTIFNHRLVLLLFLVYFKASLKIDNRLRTYSVVRDQIILKIKPNNNKRQVASESWADCMWRICLCVFVGYNPNEDEYFPLIVHQTQRKCSRTCFASFFCEALLYLF